MSHPNHGNGHGNGNGHSGGHGHGYSHNPHFNGGHNTSHQCGHSYHGRRYGHVCFRRGWCGWSHNRWCVRLGCWLYWCPATVCWYQYVDGACYVPLDDCCDENTDD